jgi:hypothetical protein
MIEAGEQASKAQAASLTLRKLARNWSELSENGKWTLKGFENSIPDIETGHRVDLLLHRYEGSVEVFKSVEMKNWSAARSVSGGTFEQFNAHITGGSHFEYYFSDAARAGMKNSFQNVFADASKANELFMANSIFFESKLIMSVPDLQILAAQGKLIDHPILGFIK